MNIKTRAQVCLYPIAKAVAILTLSLVQPISLDHSRQLVRRCLGSFLFRRLCRKPCNVESNRVLRAEHSYNDVYRNSGGVDEPAESIRGGNTTQNSASDFVPRFIFNEEPTLRPNPLKPVSANFKLHEAPSNFASWSRTTAGHDTRTRQTERPLGIGPQEPKRIFKPLEDYLIECFGSVECINTSFLKRTAPTPGQEPIKRRLVANRDLATSKPLSSAPREYCAAEDDAPFDLDPKFLLLGDVAENGTWWTGGQESEELLERHIMPSRLPALPLVSRKSPLVRWDELAQWYSLIVNAAEGWFTVYEELCQHPEYLQPTELELVCVERDLLQAQQHVQRVLLKVTETLLKRPGGQISDASQLRFLLIILENPLLHEGIKPFQGLLQTPLEISKNQSKHPKHEEAAALTFSPGHHSGIIKRVVGLLSNLPDECHKQLINWFARYRPMRFVKTKELLFAFLTYRMRRQGEKKHNVKVDITAGLVPEMLEGASGAVLHHEIGLSNRSKQPKETTKTCAYSEDWQIRAVSRVLSLLFTANSLSNLRIGDARLTGTEQSRPVAALEGLCPNGQFLPITDFYNSMVDYADLIADFESWESKKGKFSFCQYPFLMSIWAKTQVLEHDARRQMQTKARDAFFDSIMSRKAISQYLNLSVRRECLVDDSLQAVSEVLGSGGEDLKKGIRVSFKGEEGIDGGGLRKEWFLLLVREVFNPDHGTLYTEYLQLNANGPIRDVHL
jgi:E3 ubiquitin-protein ligase HECTD2